MNPYEILELNWMPDSGITDQDIRKSSLSSLPFSEYADQGVSEWVIRTSVSKEIIIDSSRQIETS